jgi:hypothetical protein
LNGKKSFLHCVVAEQFIPNPLRLKAADHLNGLAVRFAYGLQ